jgi:hypothetical protein
MDHSNSLEKFVDPDCAASFLSMSRKKLLAMARSKLLPGHPIGQGVRKMWRFRLSELAYWMEHQEIELVSHRGRNEREFS